MSKNRNSLRRVLAVIGLLSAPTVWSSTAGAQAASDSSSSDAPPQVVCETDSVTKAYDINFYNTYEVTDGKLTTVYGEAIMGAKMVPLSVKYFGGVGTWPGASDTSYDDFVPTSGAFDVTMNGSVTPPTYSAFLTLATAPGAAKAELKNAKTGAIITSGDATVTAETLTPTNYSITGSFNADVLPYIRVVPVELTITLDGQPAATYTYDFRTVPWRAYEAQQDKVFAAATGVEVYDDGSTNVDSCTTDDADCFLTTAAVGTVGLSDDCWELQTLRAFRDGALARTEAGRALIVRYYDEAPRVVAGVNRRADARDVWLRAYRTYVLPCAVMAKLGLHDQAIQHYVKLFDYLERRHEIPYHLTAA